MKRAVLPLLVLVLAPASGLAQIVPQPFPSTIPTFVFPTLPTIVPTPSVAPTTMPSVATSASGAYLRGADYVLTPKVSAPKTSLLAAATPFPRFAPDGKTLLLAGSTSRLGSVTAPLGPVLKGTRAYRSAFAPDSKNLVTSDEDGPLTVWAVPTGAVVRKIDDAFKQFGSVGSGKYTAYEVGFPEPKTILFHTGCRLKKLDLSTTDAPVALGTVDQCGRPYVSRDGKRWVIFEQSTKNYGVGLWYSRARSIDPATGATKIFLEETKVGAFSDVQLSPKGDRVCFVRSTRKVSCVTVDDGKVDDVSEGPADRWLGFDNAGGHLLYADNPSGSDKGLHHVDFSARTVRRILRVTSGTTNWHAFSGDRRVIAYGYEGGIIIDLDKGWSQIVFPKTEVEGFAPVPDNPKRAILGKASGPSRDLFWLDLPD